MGKSSVDDENENEWLEVENPTRQYWTMEPFFDAVKCTPDGKIILASSNLNGRYWSGSACILNPDELDAKPYNSMIQTSTGLTDVEYVGSDKICIGEDSGTIEIFQFLSDGAENDRLHRLCCKTEHNNSVQAVSVNTDFSLIVSASSDCSIRCWDIDGLKCTSTFMPAHPSSVNSVHCHALDPKKFLSGGHDGRLCVWDIRLPKPAIFSWQPNEEHYLAFGSMTGIICKVDDRMINDPLGMHKLHGAGIHRLAFSPKRNNFLATCSDENILYVIDINDLSQKP